MFAIVLALLSYLLGRLHPQHDLVMENLALRHQIAVLSRQVHKPRLRGKDRLFWVVLKRWWPNWRAGLIIFRPETVIGWQRAGFRMFLAMEVQTPAWATWQGAGANSAHPADVVGQSHLGQSAHWR